MVTESNVTCKVCGLGRIIIVIEAHYRHTPISWFEHFFEKRSYLQSLIHRTFWEWLFQRRTVSEATHTSSRLHCNVCGVQYKFLPAENLETPKSNDHSYQYWPGCWVARRSSSIFARDKTR